MGSEKFEWLMVVVAKNWQTCLTLHGRGGEGKRDFQLKIMLKNSAYKRYRFFNCSGDFVEIGVCGRVDCEE